MSKENSQDQLINMAMQELNKMLQNLKDGKLPEMSNSMQKLASELELANEKKDQMTEEELKTWADRVAGEVSKLEE